MKIKLWISLVLFVALMIPSVCLAVDGKVSFGCYFNQHHVRSRPDGGLASYRSQIEIGHRMGLFNGHVRPYVNLTTLMDEYNDDGTFHPASILYTVGLGWEKALSKRIHFFTTVKHFCWHPVDAQGLVESANYIEAGFSF